MHGTVGRKVELETMLSTHRSSNVEGRTYWIWIRQVLIRKARHAEDIPLEGVLFEKGSNRRNERRWRQAGRHHGVVDFTESAAALGRNLSYERCEVDVRHRRHGMCTPSRRDSILAMSLAVGQVPAAH